jgi:hypothetical protein
MRKIIATAESMPANSYGLAPGDSDKYFLEIAQQVGFDGDNRCSQQANLDVPDFSSALKALPRPGDDLHQMRFQRNPRTKRSIF